MKRWLLTLVLFTSASTPVMAQGRTGQGAALGGVAGAVVGGIIGHQNDETPEGALIGGAVGAIAGGLIGNNQDKQYAREQYYRNQIYHQQQQLNYQQSEQYRRGVSMTDVVSMSRSGVSDAVILSHIDANGVQRRPEVSEIISLHQQGVSEVVISAMQRAQLAGMSRPVNTYVPAPQPQTVYVQEHVYVPRCTSRFAPTAHHHEVASISSTATADTITAGSNRVEHPQKLSFATLAN